MRIIIYAILFALLTSCAPKITKTTTVRDSVVIKEVHHRDTIRIKGDTVRIERFVGEQSMPFSEEKRDGRADVKVTISHGQLSVKCKCDSIQKALDIVLKDTTRFHFQKDTITKTVIQFKPKTYWEKFCEWFTWIVLAAIGGALVYRFRKLIPFLA